ncbi:MAG: AMP-binding protein, partial [Acidobacteriales bacterium]|nr:AMP-binding protein [Terriglobales bacterium]
MALIDANTGTTMSYGDLRAAVSRSAQNLPQLGRKSLGLLLATNSASSVATYLAALQRGAACILLDAALDRTLLDHLIERYQPDWIAATHDHRFAGYSPSTSSPHVFINQHPSPKQIFPELALLLSTSGSTGNPKLVRLAQANLQANAASICSYLSLTPAERPITTLPMAYSYGLSVVNSHLLAGSAIVLNDWGVLQREFWQAVEDFHCTSIAGVPYTYQMLLKTGLLASKGTALRTYTQAGGRLDEDSIEKVRRIAESRGARFFVMYGQTEATARISYVPPDALRDKIGSVGVAIPGGILSIDDETGELIYEGPNVMMGYAESIADLARGDELHGKLRTGDLARQDRDGYYLITGRMRRFLKIFGKRFNLDDIEKALTANFGCPVACHGEDDLLKAAITSSDVDLKQV